MKEINENMNKENGKVVPEESIGESLWLGVCLATLHILNDIGFNFGEHQ